MILMTVFTGLSQNRDTIYTNGKGTFVRVLTPTIKYHVELLQLQNGYKTDKENCTFDKVQTKVNTAKIK